MQLHFLNHENGISSHLSFFYDFSNILKIFSINSYQDF